MWRALPDELVHYILEHLWDDVWSLYNCSLACRRFYHSPICARRLRRPGNAVHIRGHEDLDFVARAMSSKRSRRFFEQDDITAFIVEDVTHKPLAHVVFLRISAAHVPRVRNLHLRRINWARHRPHAAFFLRLAHFDSVTLLELIDCRFSSTDDLRRLTNALPSLTTLRLSGILCDSVSPRNHSSYKQQSVQELYLRPVGNKAYDDSFLAACRRCSGVNVLITEMECFRAFRPLQHFVEGFSDLAALTLSSRGDCGIGLDLDDCVEGPCLPYTAVLPLALSSLCLYELTSEQMIQILGWMARSRSICALEYLRIDPAADAGSLGSAIERTVEMCGDTLNTIRLCIHEPSKFSTFPKPQMPNISLAGHGLSLAAAALETVDLTFFIHKDNRSFDNTVKIVASALSRIMSGALQRIILNTIFCFDTFSEHRVDPSTSNHVGAHLLDGVLSRDTFDGLPSLGALLTFTSYDDASDTILDEAMDVIPRLFAPWDARGVLEVQLPQSHPRRVLQAHGARTNV